VAVTHREDISADLVVREALRRGINLFRLNTEDYPVLVSIAASPLRPDGIRILCADGEVEIGKASGIWLRRPRWPVVADEVQGPMRTFAQQEAVAAIGGVWRALAHACVSPPDTLQAARWKLSQLATASAVGFQVPDTLVTNDAGEAALFASAGPTVAKAVADARVEDGGQTFAGETFGIDGTLNPESVRVAPILFQRQVRKVADLRVTVVGKRPFGVLIRTPSDAPVDFRLTNPADATYEVANLEPSFVTRLLAYMDSYGLRFGAFDFAVTTEGEPWFLECNPSGQWGWLEPPTGLPITAALVDLLLAPQQ